MKAATRTAIAMALLLNGCVAKDPLGEPADANSVISFAMLLQKHTSQHGTRFLIERDSKIERWNGVTTLTAWWCPYHLNVKTPADVQHQFDNFCGAHDGGHMESSLCRDARDPFKVLFIASASARPGVGTAVCTDILVAEPNEQPPTREYLALLRAHGYQTAEDVQTDRRFAREQAERAQEEAVLDARKRENDLKQMHEIGTRVCRDDKGVRYTGFIEQTAERKVKISITFADIIGHPSLHPGAFQPTTIWDNPENWFVCE